MGERACASPGSNRGRADRDLHRRSSPDAGRQHRDGLRPSCARLRCARDRAQRVDDVEHKDALAIFNKITRAGDKPLANRVQGLGHTLFDFAARLGLRSKPDPFADIKRNREHPRHRFPDEDELRRLLAAIADERHDIDGVRAIR